MNPFRFTTPPPFGIAGLKLWLDADDSSTITKDGSNLVSQWNDKSDQGNNVAQTTGTEQPLWVDGVQNGKPIIRFDGVDNSLFRAAYTGGTITQPNTWFVVLKMPTSYFDYAISSQNTARQLLASGNSTAITFDMYAGTELETTDIDTSNILLYTLVFNGASSSARRSESAYLSGNAGTNGMAGVILGMRFSAGTGHGNPDIAEILIYDVALSTTDRDTIEDYLTAKWGL